MGIWVLMKPKHAKWDNVRKAVGSSLKKIVARNPKWEGGTYETDDWNVLGLSAPLTDLLAAKNQQEALADFVQAALLDLKVSGAIDAVKSVFRKAKKKG